MFPAVLSGSSDGSSTATGHGFQGFGNPMINPKPQDQPDNKGKKKRNLPGNPDPDAEVIALSPKTLLATNRFVCEICNKGFQRDQNLQLHRRGHNLPWKLKQRSSKECKKRVYVCPEPTCVHHHPSRALGDLTGIKKHYCRKHGEKKWKCDKCSKIYAVQSDWKAHSKTCGTREYRCDCGTLFSRKDSFITHRAFCDALAEESARISAATHSLLTPNSTSGVVNPQPFQFHPPAALPSSPAPPSFLPFSSHNRHFPNFWDSSPPLNPNPNPSIHIKNEDGLQIPGLILTPPFTVPPLSATELLQKAATVSSAGHMTASSMAHLDMHVTAAWQTDSLTRDFLGLAGDQSSGGGGGGNVRDMLSSYTAGGMAEFPPFDRGHPFLKNQGFGFAGGEACPETWGSS